MKKNQNTKVNKYIPKFSTPESKDTYQQFFDSGFGILYRNIISYFNNTLNIDSFSITVENLPKDHLKTKLKKFGFYLLYKHENLDKNNKKTEFTNKLPINNSLYYDDSMMVFAKENYEAILIIETININNLKIFCYYVQDDKKVIKLSKYLENYNCKIDNRIQLVVKSPLGYEMKAIDVKKVVIDFDHYYNDDFKYSDLNGIVESDDNGIIILSGVPGSGKSYLIKYLIRDVAKEFCFLPPSNVNILSDPNSLEFVLEEFRNKIIIIEDCERLLRFRDIIDNLHISTVLNISDGILADYLNLKMILTINTTDKIDAALLRKGRLLYWYNFKNLTVNKVNALAKKLEINENFTEELPLTDILNYDKDNNASNYIRKRSKIGFKLCTN